jgi:hypothetical protein
MPHLFALIVIVDLQIYTTRDPPLWSPTSAIIAELHGRAPKGCPAIFL